MVGATRDSGGRALVQDGKVYYSPNCHKFRLVPPHLPALHNPFDAETLASLKRPRWWTGDYVWLSFVPVKPLFEGTLFECLRYKNSVEEINESTFCLSPTITAQWHQLERDLDNWTVLLSTKRYHDDPRAAVVFPPLPSRCGYRKTYTSLQDALRHIEVSQEWFVLWMGLFSYLLAIASPYLRGNKQELWVTILREWGLNDTTINAIRCSEAYSFVESKARVGIFLVLEDSERERYRDSLGFFCRHWVPVWYEWGAQEKALLKAKPHLAHLEPRKYQIEKAAQEEVARTSRQEVARKKQERNFLLRRAEVRKRWFGDELPHQERWFPDERHQNSTRVIEDHLSQTYPSFYSESRSPSAGLLVVTPHPRDALDPPRTPLFLPESRTTSPDTLTPHSPPQALPEPPTPTWSSPLTTVPHRRSSFLDSPRADVTLTENLSGPPTQHTRTAHALPAALSPPLGADASRFEPLLYEKTMKDDCPRPWLKPGPWQTFFIQRRARQKLRELTAKDVLAIENRNHFPPSKRTRMFEWRENDDGVLERMSLTKNEHGAMLENYSIQQTFFDPYENEWDFCENWGMFEGDEEAELEYLGESGDQAEHQTGSMDENNEKPVKTLLEPGTRGFNPMTDNADISPPAPRATPEIVAGEHWKEDDIKTVLSERYGFVPPPEDLDHQILYPRSAERLTWTQAMNCLSGFYNPTGNLVTDETIVNFISASIVPFNKSPPAQNSWDLRADNPSFIRNTARFKNFRPVSNIFLLTHAVDNDWVLGLTDMVDVLAACRIKKVQTVELARYFLERGVPLRTLIPCSPGSISDPTFGQAFRIPMYTQGHVFNQGDYREYENQRARVMSQRHSRAALLKGGIIWRLAREHLGADSVLSGPSVTARKGVGWEVSGFVDDELSPNELDCIVGVSHCETGIRDQIAIRSWWPTHAVWNHKTAGINAGYWTERNENWFKQRVEEIRAGTAQPLTATQWASRCRGFKLSKILQLNSKSWAENIVSRANGVPSKTF